MTVYAKTHSQFATLPQEVEYTCNRYYIYSAVNHILGPNCRELIRTDIEIRTPPSTISILVSHLNNWLCALDIASGSVINSAKGEHIYVPVINNSKHDKRIFIGLIIAELIVVNVGGSGPVIEYRNLEKATDSGPVKREL